MDTLLQRLFLFFGKTVDPSAGSGASVDSSQESVSPAPIEDVLADLAGEIPAEEWERLPSDLTDRLDDHIHGAAQG